MTQNNEMKDSLGRYRTLSLFKELFSEHESLKPIYTLQEKDVNGLLSAYQIYMKHNTEFAAAIELVGSWQHWQRLLKCKPFVEHLEKWREDKEAQLVAIGMDCMIEAARDGNTTACKWLTTKEFKEKVKKQNKPELDTDLFNSVGAEIARISDHIKAVA